MFDKEASIQFIIALARNVILWKTVEMCKILSALNSSIGISSVFVQSRWNCRGGGFEFQRRHLHSRIARVSFSWTEHHVFSEKHLTGERFVKYIHARGSLRWRICHRQWAHPLNNNLTVTVACSTVTVTKCQAALHTLQAFPFFRPTCLCREPHVDPDCNSFQNFLFDHPCIYVLKKGKFNVKRAIIFSILPSKSSNSFYSFQTLISRLKTCLPKIRAKNCNKFSK